MPYPDDMRRGELDEYELTADMREAREALRAFDDLRERAREFGEEAAKVIDRLGLLELTVDHMGRERDEVFEWSREALDEHISNLTGFSRLEDLKERAGE